MQDLRPVETYGDVSLSVQASRYHYSQPRQNGLPLADYETVEVAVLNAPGHLVRPSQVGVKGYDNLFERGASPVASYVAQADVQQLREALKRRTAA